MRSATHDSEASKASDFPNKITMTWTELKRHLCGMQLL